MKKRTERNRPVTTLMKDFLGHDKQKKAEARKELHRRFEYLDYNQQIKILLAHLDSASNDRQWAYTRLIDYWEPRFLAPVLKLWENYHEIRCSWSMVQHFPKEYIIEHLEELTSIARNYYYICLRFGQDEDFTIDKTKLDPYDLVRASYKLGLPFTYDEAMRCCFSIIEKAFSNEGVLSDGIYVYFSAGSDRFHKFSTENITILKYAHYYISKMGMTPVLEDIDSWILKVNENLSSDAEWIEINHKVMNDRDFNDSAETIVKRIVHNLIPDKYRSKPAETNISADREDDAQIDTFDLEPNDMPF